MEKKKYPQARARIGSRHKACTLCTLGGASKKLDKHLPPSSEPRMRKLKSLKINVPSDHIPPCGCSLGEEIAEAEKS